MTRTTCANCDMLQRLSEKQMEKIKELEAKVQVIDKMVAALGITYDELNGAIPGPQGIEQ